MSSSTLGAKDRVVGFTRSRQNDAEVEALLDVSESLIRAGIKSEHICIAVAYLAPVRSLALPGWSKRSQRAIFSFVRFTSSSNIASLGRKSSSSMTWKRGLLGHQLRAEPWTMSQGQSGIVMSTSQPLMVLQARSIRSSCLVSPMPTNSASSRTRSAPRLLLHVPSSRLHTRPSASPNFCEVLLLIMAIRVQARSSRWNRTSNHTGEMRGPGRAQESLGS